MNLNAIDTDELKIIGTILQDGLIEVSDIKYLPSIRSFFLMITRFMWEEKIVNKVKEGNPHVVDSLVNNEIQLVINTTKTQSSIRDSYSIRRTSLMYNIPYYTTIAGAKVAVDAIEHMKTQEFTIKSLQTIN